MTNEVNGRAAFLEIRCASLEAQLATATAALAEAEKLLLNVHESCTDAEREEITDFLASLQQETKTN